MGCNIILFLSCQSSAARCLSTMVLTLAAVASTRSLRFRLLTSDSKHLKGKMLFQKHYLPSYVSCTPLTFTSNISCWSLMHLSYLYKSSIILCLLYSKASIHYHGKTDPGVSTRGSWKLTANLFTICYHPK